MTSLLLVWLALGIALGCLSYRQKESGAGLPLAYFLSLSLIHVPGALLYVGDSELSTAAEMTRSGFEQTVIGLAAYSIGVFVAPYIPKRTLEKVSVCPPRHGSELTRQINRLSLVYACTGLLTYFILGPLASSIPSATAILAPLSSLIIVGACLSLWVANECRDRFKLALTLALVPLLPLSTIVVGGFAGFGVSWAIAITTFLFVRSKRPIIWLSTAPLVFFLGLSMFVNYMAARSEIRQLVWYEQAGLQARLERVAIVFRDFDWLDLSNWKHREAIDGRLNQNWLVGAAVTRLESSGIEYGYGSTLGGLTALIPRALWPDKPVVGGGGSVVTDFTGLQFAEGTSVGAGQVLEFYVNFGVGGVIGGFLLYGWLIGRADLLVARALRNQNWQTLLLGFLPGLALLQPGGNLREILVSIASSVVVAYGLRHFLRHPRPVRSAGELSQVR